VDELGGKNSGGKFVPHDAVVTENVTSPVIMVVSLAE
jgi:hypothetical protein